MFFPHAKLYVLCHDSSSERDVIIYPHFTEEKAEAQSNQGTGHPGLPDLRRELLSTLMHCHSA